MSTFEVQQQTPEDELKQLPALIQSWKQLKEEVQELEDLRREKKTRITAMEDVIMRIMKKHEIGALDLKSSGGRLVYQKRQTKAGLSVGTLQKLLTEHLKSEEKAKETLTYIAEHRESRVKEKLAYEK
jgi:Family of unknown function (DUF5760)